MPCRSALPAFEVVARTRMRVVVAAVAAFLCSTSSSQAGALFAGSGSGVPSGNPVAASADFSYSSGVLTITLTNTSPFDYKVSPNQDQAVPSDVLTGLFFDYNGGFGPALTFNSATTPEVTVGSNPSNLKLSATPGGWDFVQSATSLTGLSQHYGLGTAGFGIFAGGTSSGGLGHPSNFGVMNSLYVVPENNPGIGTDTPFAKDSITFLLSVASFDITKVGNVRFQYGTALNEGSTTGFPTPELGESTPEPATTTLFLCGMAGFAGVRRLKRSRRLTTATC